MYPLLWKRSICQHEPSCARLKEDGHQRERTCLLPAYQENWPLIIDDNTPMGCITLPFGVPFDSEWILISPSPKCDDDARWIRLINAEVNCEYALINSSTVDFIYGNTSIPFDGEGRINITFANIPVYISCKTCHSPPIPELINSPIDLKICIQNYSNDLLHFVAKDKRWLLKIEEKIKGLWRFGGCIFNEDMFSFTSENNAQINVKFNIPNGEAYFHPNNSVFNICLNEFGPSSNSHSYPVTLHEEKIYGMIGIHQSCLNKASEIAKQRGLLLKQYDLSKSLEKVSSLNSCAYWIAFPPECPSQIIQKYLRLFRKMKIVIFMIINESKKEENINGFDKIFYCNNETDVKLNHQDSCNVLAQLLCKSFSEANKSLLAFKGARTTSSLCEVKWDDVAGMESVKDEIYNCLQSTYDGDLSNTKINNNILLCGPPGTGKTMLAKAIATEFKMSFLSIKGPEILDIFIGESEANLRRLFEEASRIRPCVMFFDEIDSLFVARGHDTDSGSVTDRLVSQMISLMDELIWNPDYQNILLIGATNRLDMLDAALLRPARFNKIIRIDPPKTSKEQENIMRATARIFPQEIDVDFGSIAERLSKQLTPADLAFLVQQSMRRRINKYLSTHVSSNIEDHVIVPLTQLDIEECATYLGFWDSSSCSPEFSNSKVN